MHPVVCDYPWFSGKISRTNCIRSYAMLKTTECCIGNNLSQFTQKWLRNGRVLHFSLCLEPSRVIARPRQTHHSFLEQILFIYGSLGEYVYDAASSIKSIPGGRASCVLPVLGRERLCIRIDTTNWSTVVVSKHAIMATWLAVCLVQWNPESTAIVPHNKSQTCAAD